MMYFIQVDTAILNFHLMSNHSKTSPCFCYAKAVPLLGKERVLFSSFHLSVYAAGSR